MLWLCKIGIHNWRWLKGSRDVDAWKGCSASFGLFKYRCIRCGKGK